MVDMKKIALFAAGTLFGSAGFKLLSSSDAKKFYTQCTAFSFIFTKCHFLNSGIFDDRDIFPIQYNSRRLMCS